MSETNAPEPGGRRMLLLTHGKLGLYTSKTAVCLLRYCPGEVVGVLDEASAGARLEEVVGCGEGVPVFGDVKEAFAECAPTTLVIGVAPQGGRLPEGWRSDILAALRSGVHVLSGLHTMLEEDGELREAAEASGARIFDVRRPPGDLPVAQMRAAQTRAFRVLTIGTDCDSGKMATAWELARYGRQRGLDARFVATGQTGIMIRGRGIAIDRVICDFAAGAAEELVLADADADVIFIEGQGSLVHPGYSGVTLSLMHGSCPQRMVLCHAAGRRSVIHYEREVGLPGLPEMRDLCEEFSGAVFPSRVAAVSLNTFGMEEEAARRAVDEAAEATGLPASDPVRFGPGPIFDALLEGRDEISK